MTDRYQAFLFNGNWLVIDGATKLPCGEPLQTKDGADAEAARLNLKEWRGQRPQTTVAETVTWDEGDPAERLLEILDKPHAELMFAEAA